MDEKTNKKSKRQESPDAFTKIIYVTCDGASGYNNLYAERSVEDIFDGKDEGESEIIAIYTLKEIVKYQKKVNLEKLYPSKTGLREGLKNDL